MQPEEMLLSLPGLSLEAAQDYLDYRKRKKSALNGTMWKSISRQVYLTGHDPDDALGLAMSWDWLGFKCDWFKKKMAEEAMKDTRGLIEKHSDTSWADGLH